MSDMSAWSWVLCAASTQIIPAVVPTSAHRAYSLNTDEANVAYRVYKDALYGVQSQRNNNKTARAYVE